MIPQAVKLALWSYDADKIDTQKDKRLIIAQVLNFGTKEASDWVFKNYDRKEIGKIAVSIPKGQWNKKSLALWSLILDFDPNIVKNRIN